MCRSNFSWKSGLDAKLAGARTNNRECGLNRFFHHVAELTGKDLPPLARDDGCFDAQQIAADLSPRQSGDQADLVLLFLAAEIEATHTQVIIEIGRVHTHLAGTRCLRLALLRFGGLGFLCNFLVLAEGQLLDDLAADLGDLTLEVTHTRFARVITHDVAHGFLFHATLHPASSHSP